MSVFSFYSGVYNTLSTFNFLGFCVTYNVYKKINNVYIYQSFNAIFPSFTNTQSVICFSNSFFYELKFSLCSIFLKMVAIVLIDF